MKKDFAEFAGWYGAVAILVSYILVSFEYLSAQSISFQLLNLTGAIGFVIMGTKRKVYPTAVLNAIWVVIAIIALLRLL